MEEWTKGHAIGRGSTATVSLAVTNSGELVAVKSAELSSSAFLQKERSFLSRLSSPHIVKYIGSNITHENSRFMYNIVMEYVSGGSLQDLIRKCGGKLPEPVIRSYTRQILKGLRYLHERGIVHCDVKSQNVLIGENGDTAKIADLGCAKTVEHGAATSEFSGTPAFMSPEAARGEEQGFAADVWAVGCTVIEMATGSGPWPELDDVVAGMYKIGFSGESPEIPRWLSDKAKDFLRNCLRKDPKQRRSVQELLQHPFIEETDESQSHCLNMASPSTVLDQDFWGFCESSKCQSIETDHEDPFADSSEFSVSPGDRIDKLVGDHFLDIPDWDMSSDDWIRVRSDEIGETQKCNEDNYEISDEATSLEAVEGVESSISDQDQSMLSDSSENVFNFYSTIVEEDVTPLGCENSDDNFVSSNVIDSREDYKKSCSITLQIIHLPRLLFQIQFVNYLNNKINNIKNPGLVKLEI